MFEKKLTDEDIQNILEWGSKGIRLKEIVALLDNKVSKQRVEQILRKNGIKNTLIWRESKKQDRIAKLEKRYGTQFFDEDSRRDVIYQIVKDKFKSKKYNAISAGIEWDLSFGDLYFPTVCPVLDIPLDYWADGRKENSISFDRIDNSKGYVTGNVVIMSWRANRIKNDGSLEEHKKICEFMEKHLQTS